MTSIHDAWRDLAIKLLTQRRDGIPPLDAQSATACVMQMQHLQLPAETVLFREGEVPPEGQARMVLLLTGDVRVESKRAGRHRVPLVVAMRGPGSVLGEMALLDGNLPRTMTCVAETPVSMGVLSKDDFFRLLQASPYHAAMLLLSLSQRLAMQIRDMNERMATLHRLCDAQSQELSASHGINKRLLEQLDGKKQASEPAVQPSAGESRTKSRFFK